MKPRLHAPSVPLFVRIAAGYGLILLVMLGIAALTLVRSRTGYHQFVLEADDPIGVAFLIR